MSKSSNITNTSHNKTRKVSRNGSRNVSRNVRDDSPHTFGLNDYNSNDGFLTSVWGAPMWHYLHTMSFNYPVNPTADDKRHYMEFIESLQYVLPCGKCRKNLRKNFKKLPLKMKHMESRDSFSRYVYKLHETVNTMLGKTSGLSYSAVRERYEHFRARCAKTYQELDKDMRDVCPDIKTKSAGNKTRKAGAKANAKANATASASANANAKANAKASAKASEIGCTEPLYGEKSRCVLQIVPHTDKCETFQIDSKCIKKNMGEIMKHQPGSP